MRKYIVDLTDNLIHKNRYDELWDRFCKPNFVKETSFLEHVKLDLDSDDVSSMKPETLGRIMSSFGVGNIMATKDEILGSVSFAGDCEAMLRELVALCLAYVIRDRLDPATTHSSIPPYRRVRDKINYARDREALGE